MMKLVSVAITCSLLAAPFLGGCVDSQDHDVVTGLDSIGSDGMHLRASGKPDAVIGADGSLHVGSTAVALDPAQQALLKRYYDTVLEVRMDGRSVGRQGVKIAGKAIRSVIAGLVNGDASRIAPDVDAETARIDERVDVLCGHLASLQATQDSVAAGVPAFRPYATFHADCDTGHERNINTGS
jgi:hypothetical protein